MSNLEITYRHNTQRHTYSAVKIFPTRFQILRNNLRYLLFCRAGLSEFVMFLRVVLQPCFFCVCPVHALLLIARHLFHLFILNTLGSVSVRFVSYVSLLFYFTCNRSCYKTETRTDRETAAATTTEHELAAITPADTMSSVPLLVVVELRLGVLVVPVVPTHAT